MAARIKVFLLTIEGDGEIRGTHVEGTIRDAVLYAEDVIESTKGAKVVNVWDGMKIVRTIRQEVENERHA